MSTPINPDDLARALECGVKLAQIKASRATPELAARLEQLFTQFLDETWPEQAKEFEQGRAQRRERRNRKYRRLWRKLYTFALNATLGDDVAGFLNDLSAALAFPGACASCKDDFDAWRAANQPDSSSPDALFAWSVRAYNAVRVRKEQPVITEAEARAWLETPEPA